MHEIDEKVYGGQTMSKRKVISIVLLAFVTTLMLACAVFFTACGSNDTPDDGKNTEQSGEDPDDGQNTEQSGEDPDDGHNTEQSGEDPDDGNNPGTNPGGDDNPGTDEPQDIAVTSISLNKTTLTMEIGESYTLVATVSPSNATDKSIIWSSTDSSVAAVSRGKVTAKSEGAATITATAHNGKMAICTVTVNEPASEVVEVTSVSLNKTTLTMEIGESETLTATVMPSNATDKSVTWTSSDQAVATVASGKITAIGGGTATITATTSNGKTATCTVIVTDPYADFSFILSGNGYALTGYSGTDTEVTVPAEYMGKAVTIINSRAFYDCSFITKITLPDTIKEIGNSAFGYCTSLQTIEIPACTRILDSVFIGCTSLEEVTLPNGLISIGGNLFTNCNSLNKVTILSGNVMRYTFAGCTNLKEIIIGEDVSSVARGAFEDCTSLQYLTLPRVDENTSFNEYCFNLKPQTYTLNGTGADNLEPAEVKSYNVGGHIFALPVNGTDWYYSKSSTTIDGVTYQYSGKPVNVTSWENMYEATVGVSWKRPKAWTAEVYIPQDNSLKKLTVTDQLISMYDEVFDGCGCEIDIIEKFPVESVSVIGETELYLDEFSLDDYILRVKHTDGWIEEFPLAEHLSEADKQQLQQSGTHTFTLSYGGQACKWNIKLNLHTFDDAVLEDMTVVADGTVKNLQVTGIPEGTEVIWENNGQTEVGEYTVTATLKKPYYEEKVLTARLYIRQARYKITYVLDKDEAEAPEQNYYNFGEKFTLPSPTSGAWEFLGWYTDAGFTQKATVISAGEHGDKSFYAKWQSIFKYINGEITGFTNSAQKLYDDGQIKSIVIPAEIDGQKITSIGYSAFSDCSGLTSVSIPDSVTSIENQAFYGCSGLTEVHIMDLAAWCMIEFSNGYFTNPLQYANSLYLNGELISDLVIPSSVTCIEDRAFYNCSSLTSITIPDSVTSIGSSAFYNCSSLTNITIPDSVTSIGSGAFYNCSGLTSVTIPDSMTSIGWSAFYNCSGLTSITIPSSVTSIGSYALSGCSGLTSITIPDSVTSIGEWAFSDCTGLTSITIPDSVTSIGEYVFYGCSGLTSVTIGNGVTSIGNYAFRGCSSLTSITIPDSVTSIGRAAFQYCRSLTSITIPDSVTSIGSYAFSECSGLTSITIPDSVTSIGGFAFRGCSSLTSVYIDDLVSWCTISFTFSYTNPLSYGASLYLNGELITDLIIPDSVTSIGSSAFNGCRGLTSVTIPDSVTSIGSSAFEGCSSLTSVTIPDSVTSIGSSAFEGCSSLTSVTIPDSVTSIGSSAFAGCSSLESITIPHSVTEIGKSAFEGCSSLTSATFKNPNGWRYCVGATTRLWPLFSSSDLSNTATAAEYLISKYLYSWERW